MAKHKLQRFDEMDTFPHVFQPSTEICLNDNFNMKGNWHSDFFKNNNPIVVELGCGKGEYTVGLSEKFPDKNFIGVDIKGSRMWRGAKTVLEKNIKNVAFTRCRIDNICSIFATDEVNEIWITFPDPQPRKARKRLTSSNFLNRYKLFLQKNGFVNLKTDNLPLYEYTANIVKNNNLIVDKKTSDLYNSTISDDILSIRTFYETMFLKQGISIKYIRFQLSDILIQEPLY